MATTHEEKYYPPTWLAPYNSFSAALWIIVFFNTMLLGHLLGQPLLFEKTSRVVTIVQTFALMEIYNAAVGNVRSSVLTTVMQVSSRFLIVYGIFQVLPLSPGNFTVAYTTLCLAWSVTEIIRYSYYAQNIGTNGNPSYSLIWLRYNSFYALYPIGVASEISIIYMSLGEASAVVGPWYSWLLRAIILTYIPGFYKLFTHMIKQRAKAFKALAEKEEKKLR